MPRFDDTVQDRPAPRRRLAASALLTAVATLAGSNGAAAFGLEQLTVVATRISNGPALAAVSAHDAAAHLAAQGQDAGLVSQDRSRLDLTRLPMSSFGDADEPAR